MVDDFSQADWAADLEQPGAWLAVVSYRDRFGALGKIAVLQGRALETQLHIDTWVMSCRAFSRRIEYAVLAEMFPALFAGSRWCWTSP